MNFKFIQPNFTTQQPSEVKTNIESCIGVMGRISNNFNAHEQSAPDMTVRISAGALFVNGALVEVAAQNTGTITAPVTDPRIDRLVIDVVTGAVSIVAGTEDAAPTPPAIPAGKLPCAQVALVPAQTEIVNADLTDERVGAGGGGVNNPLTAVLNTGGYAIDHSLGANVASADTTDIWVTDGNTIHVTGSETITSLGTAPRAGARRTVIFDGALTLTHGANLNLPGGANITTAAGDVAEFLADTTTQIDCIAYQRASGESLVGGGSSMEIIAQGSVSAAASLDFTDLSATYRQYHLVFDAFRPASDLNSGYVRTSADNGSTYDASAGNYQFGIDGVYNDQTSSGTAVLSGSGYNGTTQIQINPSSTNFGNATSEKGAGEIKIYNPLSTDKTHISFIVSGLNALAGRQWSVTGAGLRDAAAAVNAFRVLFSSGNISTMNYTLYGLRAA